MERLKSARDEESGATAVEYGLLVAAIAALIVIAAFAFGGIISGLFDDSCGKIGQTIQGTSCTP